MRAFEKITDEPCSVCLELASQGTIQSRAVMPLPEFPARLRQDGRPCCRDCQATEITMGLGFQHSEFAAARLTVANERVEGMMMPLGMMELFGMCQMFGFFHPSSIDDLDDYLDWLESHGIPNSNSLEPFELTTH